MTGQRMTSPKPSTYYPHCGFSGCGSALCDRGCWLEMMGPVKKPEKKDAGDYILKKASQWN